MRHIAIPLLVAIAACSSANGSQPPPPQPPAIGYVDTGKVVRESETAKRGAAALQADVAKWNQEIAAALDAAKKADADKRVPAAEKKAKAVAWQQLTQRHEAEVQRRQQEIQQQLDRAVIDACAKLRAERRLAVVTQALAADPALDITADVIKLVDAPVDASKLAALEKAAADKDKRIKELEASQRKP